MEFGFQGYQAVFKNDQVWSGYLNTIIYTVAGTLAGVAVTITGAYVLSRREFPARKGITALFMITMIFRGRKRIPTYLWLKDLHMLNTMWAIILPGAF